MNYYTQLIGLFTSHYQTHVASEDQYILKHYFLHSPSMKTERFYFLCISPATECQAMYFSVLGFWSSVMSLVSDV